MEKRTSRKDETAQARPKRTPLGTHNVLVAPTRPGWHRVWVSDSSSIRDGVPQFEAAGYTFVTEEITAGDNYANNGEKVVSQVTRPGGAGVTLYLMEIPEEWYQEDLAAAEAKLRKQEREMFAPQSIEHGYGSVATRARKGVGSEQTPEDL